MRPSLGECGRLLEVGGGSGFQAAILSEWGWDVESIDVPQSTHRPVDFPVRRYDGRNIPFPDGDFDVVFSSNVLEHVQSLPELLTEVRRVLRPGGRAVHLMPTATWRFWTALTYYVGLGRRAIARAGRGSRLGAAKAGEAAPNPDDAVLPRPRSGEPVLAWIRRLALPGPHGEYPNAVAELWYFSRRSWVRELEQNGFHVVEDRSNRRFYTGYMVLPSLPNGARTALSRVLGSSCRAYVTRPSADVPASQAS